MLTAKPLDRMNQVSCSVLVESQTAYQPSASIMYVDVAELGMACFDNVLCLLLTVCHGELRLIVSDINMPRIRAQYKQGPHKPMPLRSTL
jgi:hypothetical protein